MTGFDFVLGKPLSINIHYLTASSCVVVSSVSYQNSRKNDMGGAVLVNFGGIFTIK